MPPDAPELTTFRRALMDFAFPVHSVQSSRHIRRLHWYVSCRLVIEGGFDPRNILPRPPIVVQRKGRRRILHHAPEAAKGGERTILGGLKTKQLDVTVTIPAVGPVLAVSLKGTNNAFRNLTNRMEEAAGDCTNIHMAYPALVYGFWHVLRANEEDYPTEGGNLRLKDGTYDRQDVAILSGGRPLEAVERYSEALKRLSGRTDLREPPSTYEACSLTLVQCRGERDETTIYPEFPPSEAELDFNDFFRKLYASYDRRFIYHAPALKSRTRRENWDSESPLLVDTILESEDFGEMPPRTT